MNLIEQITSSLSVIKEDKQLKSLSIFLIINLIFMFVEVIYGLLSNSLSLLTDGAHMLLDCSAIIIGLYSGYLAKKSKNTIYNYGYARSEVLGTFINSVFLIFISLFIVFESIGRSIQPKNIHGENLILVSFIGLIVNLIGIYFFHTENGFMNHQNCSHSHTTTTTKKNVINEQNKNVCLQDLSKSGSLKNFDSEKSPIDNNDVRHCTSYNQKHEGNFSFKKEINDNLYAIYIHILADALGSIGVLISSFLIKYYGLNFTDPLCSLLISILILYSTWPVLKSSTKTLLHYLPENIENRKNKIHNEILKISEKFSVIEYEFWVLNEYDLVVELKIHLDDHIKTKEVRVNLFKSTKERIINIFKDNNIKEHFIEIN